MKTPLSLLMAGITAWTVHTVQAAPIYITSLTTSPSLTNPAITDLTLSSLTAGGVTYSSFTSASSVTGAVGTAEYVWGTNATNPGSLASAVTDLNITTGSLNPGVTATYGFSSLTASSVFFVLANGGSDNPSSVTAYNSSGVAVTTALPLGVITNAPLLATMNLNRSGQPTALTSRGLYGYLFQVSDFTFSGENTAANIAGLRFGNQGFDVQEIGLAVVPEPETYALILFGAFACYVFRLRTRASSRS